MPPGCPIKVAVPAPLPEPLDYLSPDDAPPPAPGTRVQVPLGRRKVVGVVTGTANVPRSGLKLRRILEILDPEPLFTADDLALLAFTARYYHHPIGEVIATALPVALRAARRGLDERCRKTGLPWPVPVPGPALNDDQQRAVDATIAGFDHYGAFLLDGVTGSGKTEVYLDLIAEAVRRGRQALVLVPEIALTPQTLARFTARLGGGIVTLHSGRAMVERATDWMRARLGQAAVVIGTRSAVFTPLPKLGLIVVDEEHDTSFKQHEGLRYHARDLAVVRARRGNLPVVLGSATPALESRHNVERGRYVPLTLPRRAGTSRPPRIEVVDTRGQRGDGLAPATLDAVRATLDAGQQALIFLNRRGYAPVLWCAHCGWIAPCRRCDARMVLHRASGVLRCHHCGREEPVATHCPECGQEELQPVGTGTQRLEAALTTSFPEHRVARIDRDNVRSATRLGALLDDLRSGEIDIVTGTQMLAKGHDFPRITLAVVADADAGLLGTDFRASERLAQLITQVAGRAGRGDEPGRVLIQTREPGHPLLTALLAHGYAAFCQTLLAERRAAALPPFSSMALLRAEATGRDAPAAFLDHARRAGERLASRGVSLLGPVSALMERRAGRHRARLLVQCAARTTLQRFLDAWLPVIAALPEARRVRWSIDVDPVEID